MSQLILLLSAFMALAWMLPNGRVFLFKVLGTGCADVRNGTVAFSPLFGNDIICTEGHQKND